MSLQFRPVIAELNSFKRKPQTIPTAIVLGALEADTVSGGAGRAPVGLWLNPLQDRWEVTRTSCLRDIYFSSNLI